MLAWILSLFHYSLILPFILFMMMSWHRNTFCITGPLSGESTGHWWISLTKGQWYEALTFSLLLTWTNCWTNSQIADDSGCHSACVTYQCNVLWQIYGDVTNSESVFTRCKTSCYQLVIITSCKIESKTSSSLSYLFLLSKSINQSIILIHKYEVLKVTF